MPAIKQLARYLDVPDSSNPGYTDFLIWNYSLGLAILFYLTLRGWVNGTLIAAVILASYGLIRDGASLKSRLMDSRNRWVLLAMLSPLLAILCGQLLRGEIVWRAYDGPLRIACAGIVFIYLLAKPINVLRGVEWGVPLSIIGLAVAIVLNPSVLDKWNGRFATYFVDPLTLGQYATLLGFVCVLSVDISGKDGWGKRFLKYIGFTLALWIAIGSGARSAWLAIPVLFLLLLAFPRKADHPLKVLPAILIFVVAGAAMYYLSDAVHARISEAISDYAQYFGGGSKDTSGGLRLSLWRSAWYLILESPLRGYGDASFPPLSGIPAIAKFHTPLLESMLTNTGAHNEFLQNMLRSGVFGLISSVLMFAVPAALFWRAARSDHDAASGAGRIGIFYIVAIFVFGLNTECFNLKFTSSFYGIVIAVLTAQALRTDSAINGHA